MVWYREDTHKAMNLRCHRGGHFVDRRGLCGKEARKEHANLKKQVLSLGDNGSRHSLDNLRAGYLVASQYKTDKRHGLQVHIFAELYRGYKFKAPQVNFNLLPIDRSEPQGLMSVRRPFSSCYQAGFLDPRLLWWVPIYPSPILTLSAAISHSVSQVQLNDASGITRLDEF